MENYKNITDKNIIDFIQNNSMFSMKDISVCSIEDLFLKSRDSYISISSQIPDYETKLKLLNLTDDEKVVLTGILHNRLKNTYNLLEKLYKI